jgi:hypothetical protein
MRVPTTWIIAVWAAWLGGCGDDATIGAVDSGTSPPRAMTGEECFALLEEPAAGFIEIQRFGSADDSLEIWRARKPGERSSVGETFPYDLIAVWIDSADEDGTCVTEREAMTYEFAHHNWDESWTVETEHATYTGREMFGNGPADPAEWGWTDTLEAKAASGATLFTVELVDQGCETMPYDLNPCLMRMRIDTPPEGWGEE